MVVRCGRVGDHDSDRGLGLVRHGPRMERTSVGQCMTALAWARAVAGRHGRGVSGFLRLRAWWSKAGSDLCQGCSLCASEGAFARALVC